VSCNLEKGVKILPQLCAFASETAAVKFRVAVPVGTCMLQEHLPEKEIKCCIMAYLSFY